MEMRIVVPDAASTSVLAERLVATFGSERISRLDHRREVGVRVDGASEAGTTRTSLTDHQTRTSKE